MTLRAGLEPGATHEAVLALEAPAAPGTYLLLLDVILPGLGLLTAAASTPVSSG